MDGPDLIAIRLGGKALADRIQGVWNAGDVPMPVDPATRPGEMRRVLAATRPAALITAGGVEGLPDPIPAADGTAVVVLTSGTTGESKGVELSHAALEASSRASLARLGATSGDRWLACLPLHHIAGLSILVRSRLSGSAPVIHDHFDAETFDKERDVQFVSLVPTQLGRLLDAGVDLGGFKAVLLGGAAPAPSLVRRSRDAGANIVVTYGMTETCGGCVYDGRALDGVEVEIGEGGEIWLRGDVLMNGYRLHPESVMGGEWFRTADSGELDGDGALHVLGRLDDLIITGGEKVSPAEVEALLHEHPAVADTVVAGRADDEWGQRVVAFVVTGRPVSGGELAEFVGARLSKHKVPKEFVFLDAIPRNANGKVDRSALA